MEKLLQQWCIDAVLFENLISDINSRCSSIKQQYSSTMISPFDRSSCSWGRIKRSCCKKRKHKHEIRIVNFNFVTIRRLKLNRVKGRYNRWVYTHDVGYLPCGLSTLSETAPQLMGSSKDSLELNRLSPNLQMVKQLLLYMHSYEHQSRDRFFLKFISFCFKTTDL